MSDASWNLLILDEKGSLSREFLDRLIRVGFILVSRTVDEARDRIESGTCRAVLIALSGTPVATLSLAFCVHEINPGLLVMVLGGEFKPRLTRLAVRAGFHLIVNGDDVEVLMASVTGYRDPAIVLL